jgi:dTMP kinase
MRGMLVTIEGVEGSGKSTQCKRLTEALRAHGSDVVLTREPDGTPMGAALRRLFETDGPPPAPLAQVFLFMAARQQHVATVIHPALSRGAVVLSDRYTDATMAYQGFGLGVDLETIRDLNALATGGLGPDLTLLLDLDPAVGMKRIRDRSHDAFEKMDLGFHRRVRDGYLEIARTDKRRVVVIDADQQPDTLFAAISATVNDRLLHREGLRAG